MSAMRRAEDARVHSVVQAGVTEAFDSVAKGYDRMVGMNPGYHRHLRTSVRLMGLPDEGEGLRLLDLGCGTGASTAALVEAAPKAEILAVDGAAEMLARASAKSWPANVRFVHAKLDELAVAGVHGPFDGVFAAYLVRNLPDPDAGLRTILSLLKPGAPMAVHDFSVADSIRARLVWTIVCWGVIIPIGRLVSGSSELYRYLWHSVRRSDGAQAFERRLCEIGFEDVRTNTVPGWQREIVYTFLGRRPAGPAPDGSVDA